MKKWFIKNSEVLILIFVLVLAFLVRIWGNNFGLPCNGFHGDEPTFVNHALNILKTGDLNPKWFDYPTFPIYILSVLYFLPFHWGNLIKFCADPTTCYYLLGRTFMAFLGVLNVFFLYKIAKDIFNKKVGIIAALMLGLNVAQVIHSHYIKNDIFLSLLCTITLYFALKIYREGRTKDYLLTGLFIGLANATKYCPQLIIYLLLAHVLRQLLSKKTLFNANILWGLLASLTGFFIGTPYLILSQKDILGVVRLFYEILFTKSNVLIFASSDGGDSNIKFYLLHLFYIWLTPLVFILSVFGIYSTVKKMGGKLFGLIFSFPLLYLLSILISRIRFDRYIIPLIPFLIILAAVTVERMISFLNKKFSKARLVILLLVMAVILSIPLSKIIYFDWKISQNEKETRHLTYQWLMENLQKGDGIVLVGILQTVGGKLWTFRDRPVIWEPSVTSEIKDFVSKGFTYLVDANYNLVKNYPLIKSYQKENLFYDYLLKNNYLKKEIYDSRFESWLNLDGYEGSAGIMMTHEPHLRIFKFPEFSPEKAVSFKYDEEKIKCKDWIVFEDQAADGQKSLMLNNKKEENFCYFIDNYGKGKYKIEIRYKLETRTGSRVIFEVVQNGTTVVIKTLDLPATDNMYKSASFDLDLTQYTPPGGLAFQFRTQAGDDISFFFDYMLIKRVL